MLTLAASRTVVVVVNAMIILTMILLQGRVAERFETSAWTIAMLYGPPLLAIIVAIAPLERKPQLYGFLLAAALMVPPAGFGLFGGWGLLYVIGLIFILFTAWQENEGRE
jgi:hypothetical protein